MKLLKPPNFSSCMVDLDQGFSFLAHIVVIDFITDGMTLIRLYHLGRTHSTLLYIMEEVASRKTTSMLTRIRQAGYRHTLIIVCMNQSIHLNLTKKVTKDLIESAELCSYSRFMPFMEEEENKILIRTHQCSLVSDIATSVTNYSIITIHSISEEPSGCA